MKLFSALFFVSAVTLTASEFVSTVYNSIEEFKAINPDAKIIQMTAQDHAVDGSRSYALGSRQTGREKQKQNPLHYLTESICFRRCCGRQRKQQEKMAGHAECHNNSELSIVGH